MKMPTGLTDTSRRYVRALVNRFPRFGRRLRVLPNGDFKSAVAAPRASSAGHLVCFSQGPNVWIRFSPKRACYLVDSPTELVELVTAILADDLHFAILSKQRAWSGTTLVRRAWRPPQEIGDSARIISWSGKFDGRRRTATKKPRR